MKQKLLLTIVCSVILFSIPVLAGNTGKIAGKVTDEKTGEVLIGINVVIDGTTMGASTDANGYYIISNVEPGQYKIVISGIGYSKKIFTGVRVSSDFTTRLDVTLSSETLNLETIVIQADVPLVRKDLTSSKTVVDAQQIQSLPVESIDQLLTLQAGITKGAGGEIHIRGGRSNEVDYTINGVSVSNPFDNSRTVQLSTNAIQELSVVSGTFNAEYGNALSGVVNTITKEGSSSYNSYLSFYTGDYISSHKDVFLNIEKVNPLNNMVAEATFGGPVPFTGDKLLFFVSGRGSYNQGYLYGKRQNTIYDSVYKNTNDPNDIRISSTGDGKMVSMNESKDINTTAKLTYKPLPVLKINYDIVYSNSKYQTYSHDFKFDPDGNPTNYEWGLLNSLEIRHTIGTNTFYSVKGSYNIADYKYYLFALKDQSGNTVSFKPGMDLTNLHADERYQPSHKLTKMSNYTFYSGGTSNSQAYQRAYTGEVKLDLTSQLTSHHEFKTGVQAKFHEMNSESFDILRDTTTYLTPTILPAGTSRHTLYTRKPVQYSAYMQDKMEFESIILNVGLRFDYFNSKAQYGPDINNPVKNLKDAEAKTSLSPRLGISFPITDKGIIHFSYGHFYQLPPYSYLYVNPDFISTAGTPVYGNANLNPEKTVTYELGLQQQLSDNVAFNVTGFYKDVRDLLALQQIRVDNSTTYQKYVNKDYGNIKGITFSLTKRRGPDDFISASIDYTYQVADGNDVNSDAFFLDLASGRQSEKIPVPLAWDQTHSLNGSVSVGNSKDWNITIVGRLGTGLPYSPQEIEKQIYLRTNSGRKPSQTSIDLMAEKSFQMDKFLLTVFLKIFNLFDSKNEIYVYDDTGRATYSMEEQRGNAEETNRLAAIIPGGHSATEYFNRPNYYSAPREVRLGLSLEF